MISRPSSFISVFLLTYHWCLASTSKVTIFKENQIEAFPIVQDFNETLWYTSGSVLGCSLLCRRNLDCVSMSYTPEDQTCAVQLRRKIIPILGNVKVRVSIWAKVDDGIPPNITTEHSVILCLGNKSEELKKSWYCPQGMVLSLGPTLAWRDKWKECTENRGLCIERTTIFDHCNYRQRCSVTYKSIFLHSCLAFATTIQFNYNCVISFVMCTNSGPSIITTVASGTYYCTLQQRCKQLKIPTVPEVIDCGWKKVQVGFLFLYGE